MLAKTKSASIVEYYRGHWYVVAWPGDEVYSIA